MRMTWTGRQRLRSLTVAVSLAAAGTCAHVSRAADATPTAATRPADDSAAPLLARAEAAEDFDLYARAEAAARAALKAKPKDVTSLVHLGRALLALDRLREAAEAADQALAIQPEVPSAIALRADVRMQGGDLNGAREDCERLLTAKADVRSHERMARLQWLEGDAPAARASLASAVEAAERDNAPAAERAWVLVRQGELHFRTGDWDEAGRCYEAALAARKDDAEVHDHLAELHAARGEFEKAVAHSDRALALQPNRPSYQHARGDIHAAMQDFEQSHVWHEKALAAYAAGAEAGRVDCYVRLVMLYCDAPTMRDPQIALRWGRAASQARREPESFDAFAWALYHAGQFDDAADVVDKAVRQRTIDADVLYRAGLIYSRSGDTRKASTYLRRAADVNPKYNEFRFRR